jgi:hypothetical protein
MSTFVRGFIFTILAVVLVAVLSPFVALAISLWKACGV